MNQNDFAQDNTKEYRAPAVAVLGGCSPEKNSDDSLQRKIVNEQWGIYGNSFLSAGKTTKTLPSGMFKIDQIDGRIAFTQVPIVVDSLLRFEDSLADKILKEIDQFWSEETELKFKHYGYLHRRGYLIYGPQGSGKTCDCQLIIADILKRDGIVVLCNNHPELISGALLNFRDIEPNRKVVCLFEDIDAIIQNYSESAVLAILDGETQIDKVINLATTNFPENLPRRIVRRPRRFDRIYKVGFPKADHRRIYFTQKLKIPESEVTKWVKATDDFSFAACAELVISVQCLDNDFEESVLILKDLLVSKASSAEFDTRPGFSMAGFANGNQKDNRE